MGLVASNEDQTPLGPSTRGAAPGRLLLEQARHAERPPLSFAR